MVKKLVVELCLLPMCPKQGLVSRSLWAQWAILNIPIAQLTIQTAVFQEHLLWVPFHVRTIVVSKSDVNIYYGMSKCTDPATYFTSLTWSLLKITAFARGTCPQICSDDHSSS